MIPARVVQSRHVAPFLNKDIRVSFEMITHVAAKQGEQIERDSVRAVASTHSLSNATERDEPSGATARVRTLSVSFRRVSSARRRVAWPLYNITRTRVVDDVESVYRAVHGACASEVIQDGRLAYMRAC